MRGPRGETLELREAAFRRKLAALRAKMEAENEALRREAWIANAPVRAAAKPLADQLWPEGSR